MLKSLLDLFGFTYILIAILILTHSAMISDQNSRKSPDSLSLTNPFSTFLLELSHVKQAMMIGAIVYGAFNFIYVIPHIEGQTEILASGYVINNHGHLKTVTQQEFYKNRAFEMRLVSGHLVVFYMPVALFPNRLSPPQAFPAYLTYLDGLNNTALTKLSTSIRTV